MKGFVPFTVSIVIPTGKWSSQRLSLQVSWREAAWSVEWSCGVLGLSGGQWLRASLYARNTDSETSLLPRLDMLGSTLPPAFCSQTCGFKWLSIASMAFGEFGQRPENTFQDKGCRGRPGYLGAKLVPPRMPAVSCEQG